MAYVGAALMPTYHMSVLLAQLFFTFSLLSAGFIINLTSIFEGMLSAVAAIALLSKIREFRTCSPQSSPTEGELSK
jgi:hypothetical protein